MLSLILFCFGTAALSHFIDKCFERGMIFRWYYALITIKMYYPYSRNSFERSLHKVLGGCIYCFGTWVFIGLFMVNYNHFTYEIPGFILLFLGAGLNYIFIELINKFRFG